MPSFTPEDLDIEPYEFVDSCSTREIKELINCLIEDGHIRPDQLTTVNGKVMYNINDEMFHTAVNVLAKSRHLLSVEEEDYIIKLSDKFKHL
jgi:hypothetical protein